MCFGIKQLILANVLIGNVPLSVTKVSGFMYLGNIISDCKKKKKKKKKKSA
jgi:hypothetical protein